MSRDEYKKDRPVLTMIKSKRSKTVKGQYDIYKHKKKIGKIYKGEGKNGPWLSLLEDMNVYRKGRDDGLNHIHTSSRTKSEALDWFWEWRF